MELTHKWPLIINFPVSVLTPSEICWSKGNVSESTSKEWEKMNGQLKRLQSLVLKLEHSGFMWNWVLARRGFKEKWNKQRNSL